MAKREITEGTKFNKWTVLQEVTINKKYRRFLCQCDCGRQSTVQIGSLLRGLSTQCTSCRSKQANLKHGFTKTRLYKIWSHIQQRCGKTDLYKFITICDEWKKFIPFKDWALTNGYTDNLSIDRIDGTKGYYPENCRWVTTQVQSENTKLLWKTNKSGYRGVCWNKQSKKWQAYISIQNKSIKLGMFLDKKDAAVAYATYSIKNNLVERPLNILKR